MDVPDGSLPNPRRLIVCCDGTWQSAVKDEDYIPSNVARLSRSFAKAAYVEGTWWQQIVFYDPGVGTGDSGGLYGIEAKRKGATGDGLNENVLEAYNFLANNWSEGDEILIFGFSRGAYTARALAGLVSQVGFIDQANLEDFPELYRMYKKNLTNTPFRQTKEFKDYVDRPSRNRGPLDRSGVIKIKVVGVFDTVGALGIPDTLVNNNESWRKFNEFHNTGLDPLIENAFHALALDERRKAFAPTLWHLNDNNTTTNLQQVWFPGVHINIGGGDDDSLKQQKGDLERIATISLAWMVECVRGLVEFDAFQLQKIWDQHCGTNFDPNDASFDPNIGIKNQEGNIITRGYRNLVGWIYGTNEQKYRVEPRIIGYAIGKIIDSYNDPMYKAGGEARRTPGHYWSRPREPEKPRPLHELGKTCESIHPSVWHRMQYVPQAAWGEEAYKPRALIGWERKRNTDGDKKGFIWTNNDKSVTLPEYVIPYAEGQFYCLERSLIQRHAPQLLKELDEANEIVAPEFLKLFPDRFKQTGPNIPAYASG
ncbi:hypothetical protein BKA62DRAFT_58079 [Auriculariales sp. MPI-PUGE-AT-0066]|nr:hypothetical protein BKA62DRAFT_58079 [Auriculariales sp. MPI-PUGE-AT-0066]